MRARRGMWIGVVTAAVAAVVFAGCGDDGSDAEPLKVVISDAGFEPSDLKLEAGDEVTFVNRSKELPHSAEDESRAKIDVSPQPGPTAHDGSEVAHATAKGFATHALVPGELQRVVFDVPAKYDFRCTFHSKMTGTIEVEDG